jgi:hypothetical protein
MLTINLHDKNAVFIQQRTVQWNHSVYCTRLSMM